MGVSRRWPTATDLRTPRLVLEPLRVDHADAMVSVLSDPSLYDVTGGLPPTREQLVATYSAQVVGHAPAGTQGWLNWVILDSADLQPVGYVQATLTHHQAERLTADVAWVVGVTRQGHGVATEAAGAMLDFLQQVGVQVLCAHIKPGHLASERVAERLGMHATDGSVDGETRWELWQGGQTA